MAPQKMTWEEIKKQYDQEWVELIDYDWPDEQTDPKAGVVRVHAKTREEFDRLAAMDAPHDSACVFVGEPLISTGFRSYSSIVIKTEKADSFGRWLAEVDWNGESLSQVLSEQGYGVLKPNKKKGERITFDPAQPYPLIPSKQIS